MKNCLLFLLFYTHTHLILAQVDIKATKYDSLTHELAKAKSDTDRVLIYRQLMDVSPNKKVQLDNGYRGLELARRTHFEKGIILCGIRLGYLDDYFKVIPILKEVKQLSEKRHDVTGLVGALGMLGFVYNKFDFRTSLYYYQECKKLMEKEHIPENVIPINSAIGFLYKDHGSLAFVGSLDSALVYLKKGYEASSKLDLPNRDLGSGYYVHFGEVYYKQGRKGLAMNQFRMHILSKRHTMGGQAYQGIAQIYRDRGLLDSARFYARESLRLEQEWKRQPYIIKAATLLVELYRTSDPAKALTYYTLASATKDSLFSQEKLVQAEKVAYEERELAAATQRKLEAATIAYDNRLRIYALAGALGVVLLIAFFLYRNNRQNRLLEAQRIRQIETEFEQKLADTEMTTLRAQMNPHFIFNCLNSIKLYTLENEADRASDYLTKFARLIRLVLENSRSELVPLQSELEALQLYIELEAMRFKQKVQFSINVAPDIDQRFLSIPPLLLQPYVENAIWHGLMHKPEGGTVSVDVSQPKENLLHIEITDDGVGRQRANELKSKSAGKHKSFGMQVTADRIRMINQLYNTQTQARIVDLVDSEGDACGTQVIIEIPL